MHEKLHVDFCDEGEAAWAVRPARVTWTDCTSTSLTSSWCDRSETRMFASHHQLHTRSPHVRTRPGVAAHDSDLPYITRPQGTVLYSCVFCDEESTRPPWGVA